MTSPSDLYEDLCQIGKGAFGIIRKVRRKTDGAVCIPFRFSVLHPIRLFVGIFHCSMPTGLLTIPIILFHSCGFHATDICTQGNRLRENE